MAFSNPSPGSYYRELDLSQRVAQVATSIGAIVGASGKGPIMEPVLITNEAELFDIFGKPDSRISYMHYAALEFLKRSSRLYVTRVVNDNPARALPLTAGAFYTVDDRNALAPVPHLNVFDGGGTEAVGLHDPFNTHVFNVNTPGIENVMFMVCAANPGVWNNKLFVKVRPSLKAGLTEFDDRYDDPYAFWVDVYVDYKSPRQSPNESFLVKRIQETDGSGNQMFIEEVINKKSALIRVRNNEFAPNTKVVAPADVYFEGGTNGGYLSFAQVIRGWDLYKDPEHIDVNILIQGGAPIGMNNLTDIADIQRAMTELATSRMDAIAVLDIPSSEQQTASAIAYRDGLLNIDSSYAAIYTPDVKIKDVWNDKEIFVPPSGHVAAAYARTDYEAETWFAPAGTTRGSLTILDSRHIYNQGHRDALTDANVNAIRFFPDGRGHKVWGADTLQTMASALSNINVRRLLNMVEKSIAIAALYSVFEPNDSILRSRIAAMCNEFLEPIKAKRGLYWYQVVCDETNNPPAVVANGDVALDIYFDPVLPAKRIHLNAYILKTGANFRESVGESA